MSTARLPLVAITMGDPAGIGPEVAIKALSRRELFDSCIAIVLGDAGVLSKARREIGGSSEINIIESPADAKSGMLNVISFSNINMDDFKFGESRMDLGLISTFYIIKACEMAKERQVDALVTSPVNKAMLEQAGYNFSGHTDLFKHFTHTPHTAVMLVGEKLRITRVTSHVPLSKVTGYLTTAAIHSAISMMHNALKNDLLIPEPRIAACGVNPHAGEGGLFGSEEIEIIAPAIEQAKADGIRASGPHSAAKLFPLVAEGHYDGVVCMYHDQGHIPFSLLDRTTGVNVTLGLPFIRTSPDHGTGYSIAGKGYASENSMIRAIELATLLAQNRIASEASETDEK